jgi:heat shock protein HslJ
MAGPPAAMQFETAFLQALAAADGAFAGGSTMALQQGERCLLAFTRAAAR